MSAIMDNRNEPMPEMVPSLGGETVPTPWAPASSGLFKAKLLKTPRGVLQTQTKGKQLLSLLWDREHSDHTPLCSGEALEGGWSPRSVFVLALKGARAGLGHLIWPGIAPDF